MLSDLIFALEVTAALFVALVIAANNQTPKH